MRVDRLPGNFVRRTKIRTTGPPIGNESPAHRLAARPEILGSASPLRPQAAATCLSKDSLRCATKSRMFVAGLPMIASTSWVRRS